MSVPNPTTTGYTSGSNSPGSSAIATGNAVTNSQSLLNNTIGGKKRKRKFLKYGGAVVPIVAGSSDGAVAAQTQNANNSLVGQANRQLDVIGGGSNKKGGMKWGCYSGGKKTNKKKRKTRKRQTRKRKTCRK